MANKFPYEDIINLPPHISAKHPQPTMEERAARFSPFAAITGYEEMVLEEARVTEKRIELSDDTKQRLNEKLTMISDFIDDRPTLKFTYFVPDKKKDGGAYIDIIGIVKRMDEYEKQVILTNGTIISINDIYDIDGDLFLQHNFD